MIPVLYEYNETSFTSFGIGALKDTTSCLVTEERNGTYELVLKYPITGSLYSEISKERIVRVQVNDNKSIQAFRIYRITAPISGIVTIYAQHISYDLSGVSVMPFTLTGNPTVLMNKIVSQADRSTNFSFQTDISSTGKLEVKEPKTIRSLLGGKENSLLALFGGEFEWDNFVIKLRSARGADNGISILYGKNLTKLEHNSDLSDVYTHLCPYAVYQDDNGDDVTLKLTEKVLPIVTMSNVNKTLIKDFSSEMKDLEKTEANLRTVANAYLAENIIGIETPNVTLSFEELRNQLGYSNLQERINLCDTVSVKYPGLGVNVKTKIVKVVYDTLKEKYQSITLGAIKASLEDRVSNLEKGAEETTREVEAVPSAIQKAVDNATDMITGANGGCIVLNFDNNSKPYEFLIMNDDDIQDATKVWRWNINGLGYSPNGYNGPYTTAITSDGAIVADFITTGTLNADVIKAGTIEALVGSSYWDLETGDINITGEINATSGSFSHVTIDDSCTMYGNLWLEGTFETYYYGHVATYSFETRIGGDAIETAMTVEDSSSTHSSHNYIMPVGQITIPDVYTDMDDFMEFGIARDRSLQSGRLISGLVISEQMSGTGASFYQNSQLKLRCQETTILDCTLITDYQYSSIMWGSIGIDSIFYGDWYISMAKRSGLKRMDYGNYVYGLFSGRWFSEELWFGSDKTSYQVRIDKDQVSFYYNDSLVGELEGFTNYVDIQGTWKTNGSNWISGSDIKTKNTIEELDDRYSVLFSNLQPRSYLFNEGKSGRKHTGFVVQEVLEAMNKAGISSDEYALCCAFGDPKDPETEWGLRYEEIIPLCVNAIQKLTKRVETLELQLKEEKK